jgi:predicted phosphodiesterase
MARIAILSDIHGNREALDAVLADVQGADLYWNIGDVIGYGPDPAYCLEKMEELGAFSVRGNHELALLKVRDKNFDIGFNMIAFEAILWTSRELGTDHINLVRSFPKSRVYRKAHLVHGCPPDSVRTYLYHEPRMLKAAAEMMQAPICVIGHTHFPGIAFSEATRIPGKNGQWQGVSLVEGGGTLVMREDMRVFLNPGSVGQPRDGIPLASYAVLDTERDSISIRRVKYDAEKTKARMLKLNLPDVLAYRLIVGR